MITSIFIIKLNLLNLGKDEIYKKVKSNFVTV